MASKLKKPYSIRKQLMRWLLIPMLGLIVLDSTALYHFANKLERETFDHDLQSTANDIKQFLIQSSQNTLKPLDHNTQKALLSDATDQFYYAVKNEFGQHLLGEPHIKHNTALQSQFSGSKTDYYYSEIQHKKVRVISMPSTIQLNSNPVNIYIQVAQTLNKRQQISQQVLAFILIPQFILLIVAAVMLRVGIRRGLNPLWAVNDALAQRSFVDLEPIKMSNIPIEITRLVDSVNELMDKLKQAIHSQNQFLADAAHQLRTPLAGTSAQIELAQQSGSLVEIKKRLQKIFISNERLIHLINQLLTLAKNQPEAVHQINFEVINLSQFVKKVLLEFDLAAEAKRIKLNYVVDNQVMNMMGDQVGLHNLIHNLIDNAIRYTPKEGHVKLSITLLNKDIHFSIEDSGPGIPESEQLLVFERFYRGQQETQFGTGLGLAIVKDIAALHKARLLIASDEMGTKITVIFVHFNEILKIE